MSGLQKIPPPPLLTSPELQKVNRWLLEIQQIINAGGLIDPGQVQGLPALFAQVAANTLNIASNAASILANTAAITALTARVVTLEARNQILNGIIVPLPALGNDGDLYVNSLLPGAGANLYFKQLGAWVAIA